MALLQKDARKIVSIVIEKEASLNIITRKIDEIVLNPFLGPLVLALVLFLMFQAVFTWATPFMDAISFIVEALGKNVRNWLGDGLFSQLIVDGIISGVGAVLVFLPQIVILFAFIITLEASGYMSRAAFLMDEIMRRAGLNGRAFIPLLSSFACAIPGIMSARVIEHERGRLTTILIAPLMTLSLIQL